MKRIAVCFVLVLLAGIARAPARAYAWPEEIEAFTGALSRHDSAGAAAVLAPDARLTIPAGLVPAGSRLRPVAIAPTAALTFTGKAAATAALRELLIPRAGLSFSLRTGPATFQAGAGRPGDLVSWYGTIYYAIRDSGMAVVDGRSVGLFGFCSMVIDHGTVRAFSFTLTSGAAHKLQRLLGFVPVGGVPAN